MSRRHKDPSRAPMLDLWRPPQRAGDPVGCMATTYTFAPGMFDEQCLARFLEIESEPDREALAFLLERESRLGGIYAGVLVDHTQAGVEHSLRWDVLPVRIHAGKQHSKLSVLAWTRCLRIVVSSANLTEPGYRTNHEVAASADLTVDGADLGMLERSVTFLRRLLLLVPGASEAPPEVRRAASFLDQVTRQTRDWRPVRHRGVVRQRLAFTLPSGGAGRPAESSLEHAIAACRERGGSPSEAWVASPFFDPDQDTSRVTAETCKLLARGTERHIWFAVPALRDPEKPAAARLAAPRSLIETPPTYRATPHVEILPNLDEDKNRRIWHAKMLALLLPDRYSALMTGSSNFTCAGKGVGPRRNAEANLVTVVDVVAYGREPGQLEAIWPAMDEIENPESVEWLGCQPEQEEEEANCPGAVLPAGFINATYRAGDERKITLRLDATKLPDDWQVLACGLEGRELLSASTWASGGGSSEVVVAWSPVQPPDRLLVRWTDGEAFLPLNVDDSRHLPPPHRLEGMSADDMLLILAASDPSAAIRAWARDQDSSEQFDGDLDSATPIDLDPLRRYDLQATFLHRVRRRARILAQLRSNLQRPVWSRQALDWRLRGMVGIAPLAERLVREFHNANGTSNEALLMLADFLIVLREVAYEGGDGGISKADFDKAFRPFLSELAGELSQQVESHRSQMSEDLMLFWDRVVEQCRG